MSTASVHADDGRRPIGADETRAWGVCMVAAGYWANLLRNPGAGDATTLASVAERILANGAFDVFAWALILTRIFASAGRAPASRRQILVTVLVGCIAAVPLRLAAAAAAAALGASMLTDAAGPRCKRQPGLVLLALAGQSLWISPLLWRLHVWAAQIDARLTTRLLGLIGQTAEYSSNMVDNIDAGASIIIYPYCTSTFPLASVVLAFVALLMYQRADLRAAHLPWLGLSLIASMLLTLIRLVLLASGDDSYLWWHDGPGVSLYALASLGLAALFPVAAVRGPGGRPG